jgi:hypothetical protein
MNIIINESQKKFLLFESESNEISDSLKNCKTFANDVIKEIQKQYKIDLKFLLGWGAAIGGVMRPLNEFVSGEFNHLNNSDVFLIVVGVTTILFFSTKDSLKELIQIIKEKNLENEFSHVLQKGIELKKTFIKFIESLNIGFHQITNIVAYAFIIPILPMIYKMVFEIGYDTNIMNLIIKRIVSSISVGLSGIVVKELIKKLVKRFSSS